MRFRRGKLRKIIFATLLSKKSIATLHEITEKPFYYIKFNYSTLFSNPSESEFTQNLTPVGCGPSEKT